VEQWLLNYARNANNPIPVASAITTKKLNAPKRLALVTLPNRVTSHQRTREIEVRYECSGERRFFPAYDSLERLHNWFVAVEFRGATAIFPNYHAKLYSCAQGVEALRAT
jgi:hypothetical protein